MRLIILFCIHLWSWTCQAAVSQSATTALSEQHVHGAQIRSPATHHRREDKEQDPNDQTWITSWAAIGDSYSAGIGCGYIMDFACARYNFSWPNLLSNDPRMSAESEFDFLACSGATSQQLLANQVPEISDGVQVITMTAGGNDVGFGDIVRDCVYGFRDADCDDLIDKAELKMTSDSFNKSISSLLSGTVSKLGENGRVYYVGYAPFFNAETTQCSNVSWAFGYNKFNHTMLSPTLRARLNTAVSKMNGILQDHIGIAGDNVVFVDYSGWVGQVGGRFCEDEIEEPFGNNRDLFFYEWSTIDEWESPEELAPSQDSLSQGLDESTFPAQMEAGLTEALANDTGLELRNIYQDDTGYNSSAYPMPDDLGKRDAILFDGIKRVFHPTLIGHSFIANLVLYHMGVERAKMFDQDIQPLVADVLPSACAANLTTVEEDDQTIDVKTLNCTDNSHLSAEFWFDIDSARTMRDSFCNYVEGFKDTNLAEVTGPENALGERYSYGSTGAFFTTVNVWVQNAGCDRPTLYPSNRTCHAVLDTILDQCSPGSTKKYGGSAAYSCEEYHMEVGLRSIKFKVVEEAGSSWNETTTGPDGMNFPLANVTLTRPASSQTGT